jgi:hypothetical protein
LLEQYIDPKGLLLDEMAFDPTFVIKHELTYTTFFHVRAKERKKILNSLHDLNFYVVECPMQEMKRFNIC